MTAGLHDVEERLAAAWPPGAWQDVTVLVAVSGGADSVALLRGMTALKTGGPGSLLAAHLNHQLREDSAADEAFVVRLCRQLGIVCEVGRARIDPAEAGDGLEAAARRARYEFLEEAAGRAGARYVVTAHTADDQAETILHRILRGTGLRGLAGMSRVRPLGPATLIRPLLGFSRAELLAYLDDLGQPYRRDASNDDLRFTRNRLRHDVLPQLARQFNPSVVDALLRLGRLAGEAQEVIDELVEQLLRQCVRRQGAGGASIDAAVANEPRYVVRELLMAVWRNQGWPMQAMGFEEWDLLAEMIGPAYGKQAAPPPRIFPGGVRAELDDSGLRLTLLAS
jgi:tRNA(Ile)-lysidine synthase